MFTPFTNMLHKHIATCRHFIVRHHKYGWAFMGFAILIVGGVYFQKEFINASLHSTLTQSSWVGGVSTTTSILPTNQFNWNNYSATSSGMTVGNTVALSQIAKSVKDDGRPGALTVLGTINSFNPRDITVSHDGASVYVTNAANDTVSMYSRNTTTDIGVLTPLATSTIATGDNPNGITISHDGASVYVANKTSDTVSMFSRNTTTGTLFPFATSTIATGDQPSSITISPDGASVYVINESGNTVSMFSRNTTTGILSQLTTSTIATGSYPYGITISPDGASVYVTNGLSNTVSMYSRNTTTDIGALTPLATSTIATGVDPSGITISPDGKSVYVTNESSETVSMYSRDTTTGTLSYFGAVATGDVPHKITISPDGASVYLVNYYNTVSTYSRNITTGLLTQLDTITISGAGSLPQSIAISPDGASVYVLNNGTDNISMYSRTGAKGTTGFESGANLSTTVAGAGAGASVKLAIVTPIVGGDSHGYTLKPDGTVWAWGWNGYGQLGDGTTTQRNTPVQVSTSTGLTDVTAIASGYYSGYALKSDGTVWAWGSNNHGELGDGTTTESLTPVQLSSLTSITAISGGAYFANALKSDGTVWAWGTNSSGQLGDGTTTNRHTPVQVSTSTGLTDVTVIAGGFGRFAYAIKSDGTVWAWGQNPSGGLGDGTTTDRHTPVQVSTSTGLTSVTAITGGRNSGYALKSDGTVWAWGANSVGQLGDGTTTDTSTPVQVLNLTGITSISAGNYFGYALKSDGTIWAWGVNSDGQLGDGTLISTSTPVQVSSLTGIITIDAGANYGYATKSDGTIWAWGDNGSGQLGDGTTTSTSTPVQVNIASDVLNINYAKYLSPGTFTSAVINLGAKANPTTMSVASTTPNYTSITVGLRAGNTLPLSGVYTTITNGNISAFIGNQYFQYQAILTTNNIAVTPTLDSVTINYNQYNSTGNLTSSVYNTSNTTSFVSKVAWTATVPSVSETVKLQVRSSPDGVAWTAWCGYTEASSTSCTGTAYFDSTKNGDALAGGHPLNSGGDDQYLQYKVFLTSGGLATPILTSVTVNVLTVPVTTQLLTANTTVSTSTTQVLVSASNTESSTITIPDSVTNATINVSALTTNTATSTTATLLGAIVVNASTSIGSVSMEIPAGVQITAATSTWDGTINVPQVRPNSTVTVTPVSGITTTVVSVIEVGYGDIKLVFDKAVRLVFAGQAGKEVGYSRGGVFTEINTICSADTQSAGDALPEEGDCNISVGSDLIIWTKHFTNFATYTQAATPMSYIGGGSAFSFVNRQQTSVQPPSTGPAPTQSGAPVSVVSVVPTPVIKAPVQATPAVPKLALVTNPVPTTVVVESIPAPIVETILEPVLTPEQTPAPEVKQNFVTKVVSNIATTITNTVSAVMEYLNSILVSIWGWFGK